MWRNRTTASTASTARRPRSAEDVAFGAAAAIAEPEEQQAEDKKGWQCGHQEHRPDNPVPEYGRQVTLSGGLRIAERADIEMRPEVPQAQDMQPAARPPGKRVVDDDGHRHRHQNPAQSPKNHPEIPRTRNPSLT